MVFCGQQLTAVGKQRRTAFLCLKIKPLSFCASIGTPFIELQQVESTNNYATGLVHAGLTQSGTAVFTHDQTAGKGQRHKTWASEAGKNIALSLILKYLPLPFSQSFLLSMATAVGVRQFFSHYAGDDTKVKWPNDIYWRDRKAGGILIENILQGSKWKASVVGIGINVNQTKFGELTTKAVSLKQITGKEYEPMHLAKEACSHLQDAYSLLEKMPSQIIDAYKKNLYKLNETVRLKRGSRVFEAIVKDVSLQGELIVEAATEERFAVGDVEWLL